ncbi:MAG: glutamine-hydrolyzing GMP synthase [Fibrobacter sp.]|jgi:GMP synthase (glutamine-hydrolysing)|nr:glutamine-hydrolyzing GMP synthase [Fibrobacter sp.]
MEKIAVLDFGGQYAHLIANRIRRLRVYSEILPNDISASELGSFRGIILSGSPFSTLDKQSPGFDGAILDLKIPVLGLCYGHQLLAKKLGGKVCRGQRREYGKAVINIREKSPLFSGLQEEEQVWMSHGDSVEMLPTGFITLASTPECTFAAVADHSRNFYGLQFHPEVTDSMNGMKVLSNFIDICGCKRDWNSDTFLNEISEKIIAVCGNRKVFLLVSGGVDSSVSFTLLNRVLGSSKVLGLHIDNGLMRHCESNAVIEYMREHGFDNLKVIDATEDFLTALTGVVDPEEKRSIIGNMFLKVKEKAFGELNLNTDEWILAQGTIYPDTIESAGTKHADRIKTHHNRVDLILELIERGHVIEPLAQLYKDEVRELGEKLGLPGNLIWRHPFPGPGLGVRVLCSDGRGETIPEDVARDLQVLVESDNYSATVIPIKSVGVQGDERSYAHPALLTGACDWKLLEAISTKITNNFRSINRVVYGIKTGKTLKYSLIPAYITRDRLEKLRAVDDLVTRQLQKSGEYDTVWQMPVVLLPLVNESGDECVVLRPIVSREAMTARFIPLKNETLEAIVKGVSSIKGIGDIFYDITHKPPATIEWE